MEDEEGFYLECVGRFFQEVPDDRPLIDIASAFQSLPIGLVEDMNGYHCLFDDNRESDFPAFQYPLVLILTYLSHNPGWRFMN